jgi:hypothetical protein
MVTPKRGKTTPRISGTDRAEPKATPGRISDLLAWFISAGSISRTLANALPIRWLALSISSTTQSGAAALIALSPRR